MSVSASAYGITPPPRWTRIEMLLALYSETISELEKVAAAEPNTHDMFRHRLKALALVSAIESGVDTQYGDIPHNVLRLCEFVRDSLLSCESKKLLCSVEVMRKVREGFAAIRAKAVDLERFGETSRLDVCLMIDVDA